MNLFARLKLLSVVLVALFLLPVWSAIAHGEQLQKQIVEIAVSRGLSPIQESFQEIPGFGVHAIYHSFDLSRVVFLRFDVEAKSAPADELIPVDGGSVFFSSSSAGRKYAVYLMGFEQAESTELMRSVRSALVTLSRSASRWKFPSFINEAQADTPATECRIEPSRPFPSKTLAQLQRISSSSESAVFSNMALGCLRGAWEGAKDELKGVARDVKTLLTDPMEFARSLKRSWNSLVEFVADFRANVDRSYSVIAALPIQAKTELFCGFIGSIGAPALIGMLAGGTGLTLAMKSSAEFLLRASRLQKMLAAISRAPEKMSGLQGFWQSLASGKISERRLSTIETLSDRSTDLAYGAAACVI